MSQQMRNGYGFDLSIPTGQSMTVSSIQGTYTATVVSGVGKGTALATASTGGGTYGPYAGGAVVRLIAGENSLVDYDIAVSPVLTYAGPLREGYSASGDTVSAVDGDRNAVTTQVNFLQRGSFPYTMPAQGGGIAASFGGKKRVCDFAGTAGQFVFRSGTMHTGELQFGTKTIDTPSNTAFGVTESDVETGGAQPALFAPSISDGVMSIAGGRFRQYASDGRIRVMHNADDALYSSSPRFQITTRALPNKKRIVWKGVVQFGDAETPYPPYLLNFNNNLFWQIKGGTGQPPIALVAQVQSDGSIKIVVQRKLANATNPVHSAAIYTAASVSGLAVNTPISIEVHLTLDWLTLDEGGDSFLSVIVNGNLLTMTDDTGAVEGVNSVYCPTVFSDVSQLYVLISGIYRYDYASVKAPNACSVTFHRHQLYA